MAEQKLRWRDLVKEGMARNQMTTEMAEDRKHWPVMIQAGTLRSVEAETSKVKIRTLNAYVASVFLNNSDPQQKTGEYSIHALSKEDIS